MKRYKIYSFPSYLGTPWKTNFYFWARLMFLFRVIVSSGQEIRMIDTKTTKHTIQIIP